MAVTGFSMMASLFLFLCHMQLGGCIDTTQRGRASPCWTPGVRVISVDIVEAMGMKGLPGREKWAEVGNNTGRHRDCCAYEMWGWHSQTFKIGCLKLLGKRSLISKLPSCVSIYWANNMFCFVFWQHRFFLARWPENTMILFHLFFKYVDIHVGWPALTFSRTLG